jgi:hypothetical protein
LRARLYLDEDILPELARVLRSAGHDVISAHEAGALGLGDEDQLARAAADGRALLSFNYRHFLKIGRDWFVAGQPHAGIVVSYRQYRRVELRELARTVSTLLSMLAAEDLDNSIWILDQFRRDTVKR